MNQVWLLYTGITVTYIIILAVYFLRKSKSHETELSDFLRTAKEQLDMHKREASRQANFKVAKASQILQKVEEGIALFELKAEEEYNQIIQDAKEERKEILATTKSEIEELFKEAETELEQYREERHKEIEKNLVKLVVSVTEKVVGNSLSLERQQDLIYKTLEEIKTKKSRS
jgi:F0F1-type ATP synthase membrane subunit b/b'